VNWKKINTNCLESSDKRWTIVKFNRGEQTLYWLVRIGKPSEIVHEANSAQECKERVSE
jgi:hypothetical protein